MEEEVSPGEVTEFYRKALPRAEVKEALLLDSPEEAAKLEARASEVDILLVHRPELLSVTWAVKALEAVEIPIALYGFENHPGAVICDIYGYLHPPKKSRSDWARRSPM